jgi:hypothetical protein
MIFIPKTRKLNRGRTNAVLRRRRQLFGDFDTIDMDEAAHILGKSTKTLQRWRILGYGPPYQLDSRYVSYSRAKVEAWKVKHDFKRTPSTRLSRLQLSSRHSEAPT